MLHFALRKKKMDCKQTDTYFQTNDVRMHAVELTSGQPKIVLLLLYMVDLVLAPPPHLNSGLGTKSRCVHTQICPCTFREHCTRVLCLDTKCEHSQRFNLFLVKFSGGSRGGAQGPKTPLLSDQTEARRAEKNFLDTAFPLSQGLDLALKLTWS